MIRSVLAGRRAEADALTRAGEPLRVDQSIQLGHLRRPQDVVEHQIAVKIEQVCCSSWSDASTATPSPVVAVTAASTCSVPPPVCPSSVAERHPRKLVEEPFLLVFLEPSSVSRPSNVTHPELCCTMHGTVLWRESEPEAPDGSWWIDKERNGFGPVTQGVAVHRPFGQSLDKTMVGAKSLTCRS